MENEKKKTFLLNITFAAVVGLIVYLVVRFMLSFLLPFVIGLILSYLVQKPAKKISEKTFLSKGSSAAILVSVTFVLAVSLAVAVLWVVFGGITQFFTNENNMKNLSLVFERAENMFSGVAEKLPQSLTDNSGRILTQFKENLLSRLGSFVSSFAANTAKKLPSFLLSCVVTVVASCYIAKDYDKLLKFVRGFISKTAWNNIKTVKEIVVESILKFAKGYLILTLITLAELTVGLFLIGIKKAFLVALIIAFVDILPVIGAGTVLIPWAIISMLSGGISKGILLLILYAAITVIRNVIEPKIIGEKIGLNPLFMLIVIFVGLRVAGLAGMIIFPIALIVVINFYKRQMVTENARTN
ncbi:MAG: sporulation integral membrane protein YtvI [Clostridia bacterium]|nr:sporulation integral membrane protein YtvI [Clostridia bacterium]